jgi:hypothetical protein
LVVTAVERGTEQFLAPRRFWIVSIVVALLGLAQAGTDINSTWAVETLKWTGVVTGTVAVVRS